MTDNQQVGERIKSRREELGLTLKDVAGRIGVAGSTVMRYEAGTIGKPKLPVLEAIAGVLGVNTRWLTGESEIMTADKNSAGLNTRDERDISKDLDQIMEKLSGQTDGPLNYDGVELTDETAALLKDAIELGLRQVKILNKEKYTPKKYKKRKK